MDRVSWKEGGWAGTFCNSSKFLVRGGIAKDGRPLLNSRAREATRGSGSRKKKRKHFGLKQMKGISDESAVCKSALTRRVRPSPSLLTDGRGMSGADVKPARSVKGERRTNFGN